MDAYGMASCLRLDVALRSTWIDKLLSAYCMPLCIQDP